MDRSWFRRAAVPSVIALGFMAFLTLGFYKPGTFAGNAYDIVRYYIVTARLAGIASLAAAVYLLLSRRDRLQAMSMVCGGGMIMAALFTLSALRVQDLRELWWPAWSIMIASVLAAVYAVPGTLPVRFASIGWSVPFFSIPSAILALAHVAAAGDWEVWQVLGILLAGAGLTFLVAHIIDELRLRAEDDASDDGSPGILHEKS